MHRAPNGRLNRLLAVSSICEMSCAAMRMCEWEATVNPTRSRDRVVALIRLKSLFSMMFRRERSRAQWALSRIRSAPCARREELVARVVQNEVLQRCVIPAKAGTPEARHVRPSLPMPASAGMTLTFLIASAPLRIRLEIPRDQLIPAASRAVGRGSPRRAARDPSRRADRCRGGTERCRPASPRP